MKWARNTIADMLRLNQAHFTKLNGVDIVLFVGRFLPSFLPKKLAAGGSHLLVSIIIEITLNENYRSTLITGAGGKVTKGTDKVGELTGSSTLSRHVTNEA